MIKFFRHVRKDLIEKNNTGKYLKYAIGEIVLVVIGILIALQLNTWNEIRKDHNSEKAILINLKKEFQANLEAINNSILGENEISEGCFEITNIIRSNNLEKEANKLDSLLYIIENFGSFDAIRGVVDEIINSGKLNIITNDSLRTHLTGWTALLKDAEEDDEFRFENYNLNLMPFLIKHFPIANGDLHKKFRNPITGDFLPIYQEPSQFKVDYNNLNLMEFENVIWHHKHNTDYVVIENYRIQKEILSIMSIIDTNLEKK